MANELGLSIAESILGRAQNIATGYVSKLAEERKMKMLEELRKKRLQEAMQMGLLPERYLENQGYILKAPEEGGVGRIRLQDTNTGKFYELLPTGERKETTDVLPTDKIIKFSAPEGKIGVKSYQQAKKLLNTFTLADNTRKMFDEYYPASESALKQRIKGAIEPMLVQTGIIKNPGLMVLMQIGPSTAIRMVRNFGEVGNLAKQERELAERLVRMEKLTPVERALIVKAIMKTALSSIPPSILKMVKDEISPIAKDYGVDLDYFISRKEPKKIPLVQAIKDEGIDVDKYIKTDQYNITEEPSLNYKIAVDGQGNKAIVEVDKNGNIIRVIEELK